MRWTRAARNRRPRAGLGRAFAALALAAAGVLSGWSEGRAQEVLPTRWSVGLEAGVQFPAYLYDDRVARISEREGGMQDTRYRERIGPSPSVRLLARYRPESPFGAYLAWQFASGETRATFSGGGAGQDAFERRLSLWSLDGGFTMGLVEWAGGRGVVDYAVGVAYVRHALDLSGGHRDAFAAPATGPIPDGLAWSERSWSAWGLSLGVSARVPLARDLMLRLTLQDQVVPVNTSTLAAQERREIIDLTGRAYTFNYRSFTAQYPALRIGLEYVVDRIPPRPPPPMISLRRPERRPDATPETRAAMARAAAGDTAGAVEVLRSRVAAAPEDASAWRGLALLLAAQAERNPALHQEAWEVLQRALNANPGDAAVLSAYGRVRSLLQRSGRDAPESAPPTLSDVSAEADAAGGLSVAWGVSGLAPAVDSRARYRVEIEVVDPDGLPVPVGSAARRGDDAVRTFVAEREGPAGEAVVERLELRLGRARSGAHTLRLRLTDLATGRTLERSTSFEIR